MATDVNEYIQSLLGAKQLSSEVVFHTLLHEESATYQELTRPLPSEIQKLLCQTGIDKLYKHQAQAIDHIRAGHHIVCATPTASGKTLIYNLPVLEKIQQNHNIRALYLFPLKALAQDQLKNFNELVARSSQISASAKVYDGDTPQYHRKKIRDNPPNVLITNPEMLHLSLLPYHDRWATFFSGIEYIVVDEVHTYRGVMGSHMAQVFRRLQRICKYYGSYPTFIFCSATVANPGELTSKLTGLEINDILESGAPRGGRHLVFIDPIQSPAQMAILLLKAALHRKLRTIIYTQSRKMTELIAMWAGEQSKSIAQKISAYRAGFLPEERRKIEQKLSSGELLAVISTSALELGIDIGDLDLCILAGYPGTITSSLQRSGRVGRKGQSAAMILIAGQDALDQYFMRHPQQFVQADPESAVINPYNPDICDRHLICAASELSLHVDEPYASETPILPVIKKLVTSGELLCSDDGKYYVTGRKRPQRDINLRGIGNRYIIYSSRDKKSCGEIDGYRALKETHPGAIYLHSGHTYRVDQLDIASQSVYVSPVRAGYYTRYRGNKTTDIIRMDGMITVWGTIVCLGRLKVTDQVTGYEKWDIRTRRMLHMLPLDLPPYIFETEGIWFQIPEHAQKLAEEKYYHFMGGIHAIEHAMIGIFPLLVLSDRNDLGGISTTFHKQLGHAAVFIYDSTPGGAGLTNQAFQKIEDLLLHTLQIIQSCECENGCPRCVHSPKCGSGNRPIDKHSAVFLLETIQLMRSPDTKEMDEAIRRYNKIIDSQNRADDSEKQLSPDSEKQLTPPVSEKQLIPPVSELPAIEQPGTLQKIPVSLIYGVLDIETKHSAQDVGGWHLANKMGISCAVLYNSENDTYETYLDHQIEDLIAVMRQMELIIGFNIKRFDYRVLTGYIQTDYSQFPTLDLLEHVHHRLGYRLSLGHLGEITLGVPKSANGLQALRWWKEGKIDEIIKYCKKDVQITRDLYLFGKQNEYVLFQNKAKQIVRLPVNW
jgi:DEAD/DEAH box helicase domain-containing protein